MHTHQQAKTDCKGRPLQLLRTVEQWSSVSGGQPAAAATAAAAAAGAAKDKSGRGGKKADQLSAHHPTTHGPTDHKHMCVNSKYEYNNNNNNKYNNNNNNELLAWR